MDFSPFRWHIPPMKVTARGAAATAYILTGFLSLLGAWFIWYMTPKLDDYFFPLGSSSHYPSLTTLAIEHGRFFAVLLALTGIAIITGAIWNLKNAQAKIALVMKAVGILTFSAITVTTFAAWTLPLYMMVTDQRKAEEQQHNKWVDKPTARVWSSIDGLIASSQPVKMRKRLTISCA